MFPAKETLFKAVYPVVGTLFGFDAAEVAGPITADHLVLRMTVAVGPALSKGSEFQIAYQITGHRVLTWLCCPAP